jgi:hypothetical protein
MDNFKLDDHRNVFDPVCERLEKLGIQPRPRNQCAIGFMNSRGQCFSVVDILDRFITVLERLERSEGKIP